ncbi:PREDICTED: zinc finger CCCH domain-containing protein 31 [Fragaria vesca subsp. vesca]|uniref:zinc finger CCCH domain-containing protein 31 n=1 Tax=Fragaria vesca subsp. vesca TaxID=101020 RepID=UPI0002C2F3D5|nr:PREDICTED: zinc finger CCCH domain-containing protein 31 [Fragaria vesca subsp. vesca]
MASPPSPTSSCSSARSSTFASYKFSDLPVTALREKIVEKILDNRVTLIVGETGCGKSSQIPQFLLEANVKPILCTQPRRFAVVAVAKMVAQARNSELGGEVGYHIGHSKHMSPRSVIVFKTAGVLLDEMRDKGTHALDYKVIVLDEVHERSVESDLVLVCLKQFMMKNNNLRVVLMSATADIQRYKDYFKDLGRDERVEVVAIPNSGQKTIFQKRVSYLEEVADLLNIDPESLSLRYCSGITPSLSKADIEPEVHSIIHQLVLHIHKQEPDIEKSILIFLPTYYALEQQWFLLKPLSSSFKVHILHSSIDTEQALMTMKIWKSHRKVILATNIAESSVTIPQVAYVIDSCRSLQVFWNADEKKECAKLVWVSKSQADQRRGRTGRTCDGQIYRLVTRPFYGKLEDYEGPSILRLSLRMQVLHICCSDSKAINDPKALLQKALDPPPSDVVEEALNLLVHMHALERISPRGRYEPTFYGRLLASFSLSFDASVVVLKFGDVGMLREGILLGILMDTQPLPILRPFGDELLCSEYADSYFNGDDYITRITGKKETAFMGNLCAYQFWQRVFKDKLRVENLKQLLQFDVTKATKSDLPKMEDWCSFHNLVHSSLNHVSEIYEDILHSVHRFRPKFLSTSNGLPPYYDPYEYEHTCILTCQQPNGDTNALDTGNRHLEPSGETTKCVAVPFVASDHFRKNDVAKKLTTIVKQIRMQHTEDAWSNQDLNVDHDYYIDGEAPVCIYYINGFCKWGSECRFSHSLKGQRTPCKFFYTLQGCRNGESCLFSHNESPLLTSSSSSTLSSSNFCVPEESEATSLSLLKLFSISSDGYLLLLDDTNLHFTSNFASFHEPSKIITTTSLSDTSIFDPSLTGVKIFWGLHHPYQTIISKDGGNQIPWKEVKCMLWFPNLESFSENLDRQKAHLQIFFEYLAVRMLGDALEMRVILTMNNIRFSQLQVEKLGRDCFFFLTESFPFDEFSFGELPDKLNTKKPMMASRPTSYVFDLHPPSDFQFGNYATLLQESLRDVHQYV